MHVFLIWGGRQMKAKAEAGGLAFVCCESETHLSHLLAAFSRRWALVFGAFAMHLLVQMLLAPLPLLLQADLDIDGGADR